MLLEVENDGKSVAGGAKVRGETDAVVECSMVGVEEQSLSSSLVGNCVIDGGGGAAFLAAFDQARTSLWKWDFWCSIVVRV